MNKNEKRKRIFARKNEGQCQNVIRAYDRDGMDSNNKPARAFVSREIALVHVAPTPGKKASVARNPVIDKTIKHWTMADQIKWWTAPNRAAALEVIANLGK